MILTILRNGGATAALLLILALLLQRKCRVGIWHIVCICVLGFSVATVYTLAGISPMSGGLRYAIHISDINFVPFLGIFNILQTSIESKEPFFAISNILGNIAMFMPLGFLLPLMSKRYRKLWKTMLFGFAVSLAIEVIQLFLSRGSDIDDLLLNVIGALAGYGVYRIIRRRARRFAVLCSLPKTQRRTLWRFFPYVCVVLPLIITFAFGYVDRNAYLGAAPPENAAVTEADAPQVDGDALQSDDGAIDSPAAGNAQTDADPAATADAAPAAAAGDYAGMLVIDNAAGITLTSTLDPSIEAVTPNDADLQMLMGLLFGRNLTDALPAATGDLLITAGDNSITVNTATGDLVSKTASLTGAARLPQEDLLLLRSLLANYDLPVSQMEQ